MKCAVSLCDRLPVESFRSLEFQFRVCISEIVFDITRATIKDLSSEYLTTPNATERWLDIEISNPLEFPGFY